MTERRTSATGEDATGADDLSFLAPPEEVGDWRMVVLFDAACQAGLDGGLAEGPARADDLASRLAVALDIG